MENSTTGYIELVEGSLSNRGKFIKYNEIDKYYHQDKQVYRSMFLLDDSIKEVSSVKDYKGKYSIDRLVFDFDLKGSRTALLKEVMNFKECLIERGVPSRNIQVWFSGTGFHVITPDYYGFESSEKLPEIVRETIRRDFLNYDLDLIYDNGRIIRLEYSLNEKSGLYKIPIHPSYMEEYDYNEIMQLAKESHQDYIPNPIESVSPIWQDKIAKRVNKVKAPEKVKIGSHRYTGNVTCVQKMADSDFKHGRNNTLLRMGMVWRNEWGLSKDQALAVARVTLPSLPEAERDKQISRIYKDYSHKFKCDDHIMSAYCDGICRYYSGKNFGVNVKTPKQIKEEYIQRLMTSRTEFNLRDVWDIGNDYFMEEGQFIVVIADTGVGKSAWLQNLSVALKDFKILYITLEMSAYLLLARFFQISQNKTYEEIKDEFSANDSALDEYLQDIKHINIMETQPMIDSMKELVVKEAPDIVMVDTMDKIIVPYANDNQRKMEKIAYGLQRMAVDTKTIVIGVAHISRGAVKDEKGKKRPLDVHSAKDSSAIEQNADKLIIIDGTAKNPIKTVSDGKTRTGRGFRAEMRMIGDTFKYELVKGEYGQTTQRIGRVKIGQG